MRPRAELAAAGAAGADTLAFSQATPHGDERATIQLDESEEAAMTLAMRTVVRGIGLVAALLSAVSGGNAQAAGTVERMYILYCGESTTKDVSANWSPGVNVGVSRDFSDNCYLIKHADGWMLWDTGMSDAIAKTPEGVPAASGLLTLYVKTTLASQLQALNVAPSDVTRVAFSHFHSDHVGNANLFSSATLYIQEPEYDAAFGPDAARFGFAPRLYDRLTGGHVVKLRGDHDVFGDGSVTILSTPGHTPGHQSLLVQLPDTGAVVLSGDMVHFQDNWDQRRVPARNFDKAQTLESMERVARLLEQRHARLWINHDKAQSDSLAHAPAYVR
jgi:glyoxylase-like metal-dependent hydrolase (beta-lactamase superfamily II)